ncbi:MAG: hypothetical protein KC419_12520, partial [Anaerolineales bacterium]|nr:hypothetical protein [Anaerolineales bacterium]
MNERNYFSKQRNARFLRLCTIFALSTTLLATVLFMLRPNQVGVQVDVDENGRFTLHLLPTTRQSLHIQHTANAIRISSAGGVRFDGDVQRFIQLSTSDDTSADMHITLGSDEQTLVIAPDAHTDVWLNYDDDALSIEAKNTLHLASAALNMPLAVEIADQNRLTLGATTAQSLVVSGGALHLTGPIVTNGDVIIDAVNVRIDADGAIQTSGSVTIDAVQNVQLTESRLQAAGNVRVQAGGVLLVRDSEKRPFQAQAGGTLQIQGSRQIDISALSHPASVIASGGDMR